MPRVISGDRVARSFVSPTGAAAIVSRVLDFQLAADQGIEMVAVLGYGSYFDNTPAASDTVPANSVGNQSLHLEEGATEDLPNEAGEDADDIDTEIFYVQSFHTLFQIPATAGGGGGSTSVLPSGLVIFRDPILSPRNITHKGVSGPADSFGQFGVLIYYHYVEFSNAELGVLLARR